MSFYAVAIGKTPGVYTSWDECKLQVTGFKGAIYKKFANKHLAEQFILENGVKTIEEPSIIDAKEDFKTDYYVYTDGACSNNGRPNAKAGIGIYFSENNPLNVSRALLTEKQTNNVAEMTAVLESYQIIESDLQSGKKIGIVTDSEYVMKSVTTHGEKNEKSGWKKEIPNRELVKQVYEFYRKYRNSIKFIHTRAHTTKTDEFSLGNAAADKLANEAIGLESCPYQAS
jgi:ribonuclease HI